MKIRLLLLTTAFLGYASPLTGQTPQGGGDSGYVVPKLFWWLLGTTPDWRMGVFLAVLGLVGALVTVYFLIGGAVPGTAGYAKIEANAKLVEERERELQDLIEQHADPELIAAVEVATNNLRDDVRTDRRRQWTTAAFLYSILGAFFAMMLARDLLQAFLIGAGWTSYLGSLGLKQDYATRKEMKDKSSEALEAAIRGSPKPPANLTELLREARVARTI